MQNGVDRRVFIKLGGMTAAAAMIGCGGNGSPRPRPLEPEVRFAIIGDFGETTQFDTFPVDRVGALVRGWNPDFIVALGDDNYVLGSAATIDDNIGKNFTGFIYPKGTSPNSGRYPYPPGAPLVNRFFSVLGNHDYADWGNSLPATAANVALSQPYIAYFAPSLAGSDGINLYNASNTLADGSTFSESPTIRFYDVVRGPVHLFGFDSNYPTPYGQSPTPPIPLLGQPPTPQPPNGIQGTWLQQRLAASSAPWKLVFFHHPPYCSGAGAEMRTDLRWPFAAWGASAVITAHVHNYERLDKADPSGGRTIPYFVNGAGGFVPEEGFNPAVFVDPGSRVRVENYGAQLVSASPDFINFAYYDINGNLRDSYSLFSDSADVPAQVAFESLEYVVREDGGSVVLRVVRVGPLDSLLGVAYMTVPGTARPGVNYEDTRGLLLFPRGIRRQAITIRVFNTGPGDGSDLTFSVALSDPRHPSPTPPPSYDTPSGPVLVGTMGQSSVLVQDTADTPLNNPGMFVDQTYRDLLARVPSAGERTAALAFLNSAPPGQLQQYKAQLCANLVSSDAFYGIPPNATAEPIAKVAQILMALYVSPAIVACQPANVMLPTYTDLEFWSGQLSNPPTPDQLVAVAQGLGQNALEILYSQVPEAVTNATIFIIAAYYEVLGFKPIFVTPPSCFGGDPTIAFPDIQYWETRNPNPVGTDDPSRYRMLSEVATRPSSQLVPAPSGITAFDLVSANKLPVSVAVLSAGLRRIQFEYPEYANELKYAQDAGLVDVALKYLNSAAYRQRFA